MRTIYNKACDTTHLFRDEFDGCPQIHFVGWYYGTPDPDATWRFCDEWRIDLFADFTDEEDEENGELVKLVDVCCEKLALEGRDFDDLQSIVTETLDFLNGVFEPIEKPSVEIADIARIVVKAYLHANGQDDKLLAKGVSYE